MARRGMVLEAPKPKCATLLVRISDARDYRDENGNKVTDEEGIKLQIKNGTRHADRIGWAIGIVRVENDVSAFKRKRVKLPSGRFELRTIRPEFRATVADLESGVSDGLLVSDIDRAMRDMRDLEDLVDVVEGSSPRIPVDAVSGSLKLGNDSEVKMARVLVAMANGASKDTSRRVIDRRADQAEKGKFGGGARPYGFGIDTGQLDRITKRPIIDVARQVPAEAAEILRSSEAILTGSSVRECLAEMRTRGADIGVSGRRMVAGTWRDILCRPRNAGLSVYDGDVVYDPETGEPVLIEGVDEDHPPIVDRATWEAVTAILTSPHRTTTPGPAPRWLGSGIYVCGHANCAGKDTPMRVGRGGKRKTFAYLCTSGTVHLARSAEPVDRHVEAAVIGWLAKPEAREMLTPKVRVDTAALATQTNAIRESMADLSDMFFHSRTMNKIEYMGHRKRLEAELAEVTAKLDAATTIDPLAGLAGNPAAGEKWDRLSLAAKRVIMRAVVRVTILPSTPGMPKGYRKGSGVSYVKPGDLRVEWTNRGHTLG